MTPLFSIITVAWNAEDTILPTLESIGRQTFTDYEYIVIDGASTDRTVDLVKKASIPGTTILSEPDNGIYDAMNKGLEMAHGEYVIFLNAGDSFHAPDTLRTLAGLVEDNERPGILYGQTDIVGADRRRKADRHLIAPEHLNLQSFAEGMVVCHQAFVPLRRITPMYNTDYRFSADYEWCIICLQHSRNNVYAGTTLVDYLDEGMTTANRRKSLIERFKIMCRYYGVLPTVARHLKFIPRYLRRRHLEKSVTTS